MVDLNGLLDLNTPDGREFFAGVQGNILKGHGRDHTAHILITFAANADRARAWVADFASEQITSGLKQWADTEGWKAAARAGAGQPFATFYLTSAGYAALGLADRAPNDPYFRLGMKVPNTSGRTFNDPLVPKWEDPFRIDLHAMILLADDDCRRLDDRVEAVVRAVVPLCSGAPNVQRGDKLKVDFGDGRNGVDIEHFGHQDGISNPQTIASEAKKEIDQRGKEHYDPSASLSLLLTPEPAGGYGSYLVLRKLEQNVSRFRAQRAALAQALGVDEDLAAALAVGRFRNGAPLLKTALGDLKTGMNDFGFRDQDPTGAVCPLQAHIRKTNPRGDAVTFLNQTLDFERQKRIARRGITYGMREDLEPGSTLPPPEKGIGLLFMSHQASIDQFAIQQEGSDSGDFVTPGTGIDAVIGQGSNPQPQKWPGPAGNSRPFLMNEFVTMLGGEYFFAPSMGFLRGLSAVA
jgi:deferrochelatase/peroxidase EfeB